MSTLTPNGDEEIIAAFMQEFDAAADKPAVVRQFSDQHPHLAAAFADYESGRNLINQAASPPGPAPHSLRPGEMLGEFRVLRFVAHGGMGEIYEAEQIRLSKRRVALKVIRQGYVTADARDRFLREQAVLARLHQSNIVPVFAAGERDRLQYFAMQFIDGATLGSVVTFLRTHGRVGPHGQRPSLAKLAESAAGPRPDPTAPTAAPTPTPDAVPPGPPASPALTEEYLRSVASALADVADALDAAHAAHFLHRDVKPSNLMVEKSGKCWVIDFGLAGLVGEAGPPDAPDLPGDPALTGTGSTLGTPAYMAPEQFDGRADRRSDVWSLGATLYELLALNRPFPGPTREDFRRQVNESEPAELRSIPPDLAAVCRKALRKDPAGRYQTAGEFAADLRHWLKHEPTAANPPWVWRRMWMWAQREPGWASAAMLALVALLGGLGLANRYEHKLVVRESENLVERNRRESEHKAAAEKDRISERSQTMLALNISRRRVEERIAGWRAKDLAQIRKLSTGGFEPELQDSLSAIMSGLDAYPVVNFSEGTARSLVFDGSSGRLLIRGVRDDAKRGGIDQSQPTRVRDLQTGAVKVSTQAYEGPIGWRGTAPVQLVLTTKETPTLVAWDVDRSTPLEEFAFPDQHQPMPPSIQSALALLAQLFRIPAVLFPSLIGLEMSGDVTCAAAIMRSPSGGLSMLIWRTGTRAPVSIIPLSAELPGFSPNQHSLSPDGSLLALGSDDGRVAVWSLAAKPSLVGTFRLGRSRVTSLAFARHRWLTESDRPDPKGIPGWLFAAGDSGGQVVVWDLGRLQQVTKTRDAKHEVFGIAFSPDAVTLYATGRQECRCWDVRSGRQVLQIQSKRNVIAGLTVSPNGRRLALCTVPVFSSNGGVDLFELESGRGIQNLRGLTGQVSRVTMTSDGKRAAGLTQDWQIGVWDCESGELLMAVDAPLAMYADHDDIRLSDDGRFLIVAGGQEAHRWEIPVRPSDRARKADTWKLNPAWSNRLDISLEGRILLCRNETQSGKVYPNAAHPKSDPRCVRIYELVPGNQAKEVARHDDHAWHVFSIQALPGGSGFIGDGIKTGAINSREIIAYSGTANEVLWRIPCPHAGAEGNMAIDSTGTVLTYWDPPSRHMQRLLPFRGEPDTPATFREDPIFGLQIVRKKIVERPTGLHLSSPGAASPFLTLSPDERLPDNAAQFAPNGQFLVWGNEAGTVYVGDLARIRRSLVDAGFPGW